MSDLSASSLLRAIEALAYVAAPSAALAFLRSHPGYVPSEREVEYLQGCVDVCDRRYLASADASEAAQAVIMRALRAPGGSSRPVDVTLVDALSEADRVRSSAWDTLQSARAAVSLCDARRNSTTRTLRFK